MSMSRAGEHGAAAGFAGAVGFGGEAGGVFAELFYRNPQPMIVCDSQSLAVLEVNNACCALYGYARTELLRKSLADLIHPDEREAPASEGAASALTRHLTASGHVLYVQTRTQAVNFHGRRASLIVVSEIAPNLAARVPGPGALQPGAQMDSRHSAETAEQRRRDETIARLAAIVDSSADAIIGCDMEGRIVSWNPGAGRLYGWTAREAVGQPLTITMPSEERVNSGDRLGRLMTGGAIREAKVDRVTKDGRKVTVRLTAFPVHESDGKLIGTAFIAHDITDEQKSAQALARAELARRQAEERLRAVVRHLPVFLGSIDMDGMLTLSEGRSLSALGAAPGAFIGQNIRSLFPADHAIRLAAQRALNGDEVVDTITYREQVFQFLMAPMRDGDQIIGAVCVLSDVTERSRAEQAVLQAEKLESLVVLAGGVAHDFNNLLHVIMGNADLALMSLRPSDEPVAAIGEIKNAARRAADLARQMLAYAGHGRATVEAIDIPPLVHETLDLLRVTLPTSVNVVTELASDMPRVEGDPTQLRQVLMNLIINAAEAIGQGPGEITVSAGILDVQNGELGDQGYVPATPTPGRYAAIEVSDSGEGMAEATTARIFDPFFTTKFTGRGLGLAAVLGIVRGHGGAIRVESEPGRGTVFTVVLPLGTAKQGSTEPDAPQPRLISRGGRVSSSRSRHRR